MSYPEPRYLGKNGEVSSTFRAANQPPDVAIGQDTCIQYLATGASTHEQFGLYRWDMGPEPAGAGAHYHRTFSESFFVVSGSVQLFDGNSWLDGQPGDFVYVPEGGLHAFRNDSGAPASMLILFAPGAPREAYFEGLVELAEGRWKPSHDELQAFFEEHDNIYV